MSDVHLPVMLSEILHFFSECVIEDGANQRYFDGTFGRGGHLRAILEKFPKLSAVAMDRDLDAVEFGRQQFANLIKIDRLKIEHGNYREFDMTKNGHFDIALLDLGVSSPQLDQGQRGFSFLREGPMDMRMNQNDEVTAEKILHECDEDDLFRIFRDYGEVQRPGRVVRAILNDRKTKNFNSTLDFANMIARIEGWHKKGHHPATKYFQALRIAVNDELRSLEGALRPILVGLKPKGRLAVLTFHSLEDRIVKTEFKSATELGRPLTKKVVRTSREESDDNSRARSAKLRVFERSEQHHGEND